MNLIQKYFLLVAKRPVAYVFWTVFTIFIVIRFGVGMYYDPTYPREKEMANTLNILLPFISLMVFIIVAWINDSIVRAKITVLKLESCEMGILIYPDKQIVIYDGPVWGKPFVATIRFPEKWNWKVRKGDAREIEVSIKIDVNDVIRATVPILIKFTFSGPFILDDLKNVLQANFYTGQNHSVFSISKAIKKIVFDLNKGVNHDLIKKDSLSYLTAKVKEEELISDISERIKFPEKLFINVAKTDIEVGLPKFSFEKEWND